MDLHSKFSNKVAAKYQIYNSLFLTLPFEEITNTGVLLPVLFKECQDGFNAKKNPTEIIDTFFDKHTDVENEEERIQLLFKFMQYIERQVVLFDAVEDAAFEDINDLNGNGTVRYVFNRASSQQKMDKLIKKLEDFKVRIVLTAHPTQFYPGRVLSIIGELENAIRESNLQKINELLQQLGRTAFVTKEKPTPYDEAIRLMWYLENVFYHSVGNVHARVRRELAKQGVTNYDKDIINIGFWPCGDRDGNPFVTSDITLETARQLRHKIFICYFRDAKKLRKRMTFTGVDQLAEKVYAKLSSTIFNTKGKRYKAAQEIITDLEAIKTYIVENHQGLFVDVVEDFIVKVKLFGFHFTYMDIRQDSRIHGEVIDEVFQAAADGKLGDTVKGKIPANYAKLSHEQQIEVLIQLEGNIDPEIFKTEIVRETLKSFYVMKQIQEENGETGCHRYIISNTQSSKNMFEVYALARICGWKLEEMTFDIVPLLETVEDLDNGEDILGYMYNHPVYKAHLKARNKRQYVMLGFSDGTKDGGYLKANWSIFTAKENLSGISKTNKVKIIFFDGRGGPPARGGGNTNKFYSSLGDKIEDHEIQLTIQGQTISSNFGTLNSSQYNLEQFFCAGLENTVFKGDIAKMNDAQRNIMNNLADLGFEAYNNFKNDPIFVDYLEDVSVLQYYGKTNIGSRPSKRKSNGKLNLSDLRAIPFVGAWTQMKQNVPGFYGVGAALKKYEDEGRIDEIKNFYSKSLFFRTLIDNSIQSVCKSYFPLTSYLEDDKKFGKFWKGIYNEFNQTKRLLLYISDQKELMERSPNTKASIELREKIILPLITMQQYALMKVKAIEKDDKKNEKWKAAYEMMIIRAFFGSINASRNAA